jgi:hypothetical protein
MNNLAIKSLLVSPLLLASMASSAFAGEATLSQVRDYADQRKDIGQVTSVSQLRDVKPTDWAFQALQSLVERYGCIAGYPDGTFRGNRAMTRYEFAAGLNACLDRVNELIASATADLVTKEDLAVLQRLQEEFQAELATLRGRVDALEAKTAKLEAQQFSTTTKLSGTVIFDLGSAFEGKTGVTRVGGVKTGGTDVSDEVTLGGSVRLDLNTSFTGKDLLKTALTAQQIQSYAARTGGTTEAELFHTVDKQTNNIGIEELWYRFPVGKLTAFVGTHDLYPDDIVPSTANLQSDTVADFFGGNNLSYDLPGGAGAGFNYQLTPAFNIAAAYLGGESEFSAVGSATTAGKDSGLTSGSNSSFAQLTFTPGDKLTVAATYTHAYSTSGVPGGLFTAGGLDAGEAVTVDAVGLNAGYKVNSAVDISGWVGYGWSDSKDSKATNKLFNWAVNVGLPDLFRKGNYGGLSVGSPTYATSGKFDDGSTYDGQDTPLVAQAFYRFKVSDNISIQPGVLYIANPQGNKDNDNIWIGNIRTKFTF